MSHGADGAASHGPSGGASFDHGGGHSGSGMHSLGHGINHSSLHGAGAGFGLGSGHAGHAGSAMFAAVHGSSQASAHYGTHAMVMVWGMGMLSGGHVINLINSSGPSVHDGGGHVDGPGANKQSPKDLRLKDVKGARLLVGHALGLKDHGSGFYGDLLDIIAKKLGLMRIDSRPNLKGEDSLGLDGIMPWNAWGDSKSKVGPDGYEPLLRGFTDKIIHVFAIPTWSSKKRAMHVSPDEVVTVSVRLTVWHYAQTQDVEVKIEVIVNSTYVFDPFQNGRYTFYGKRTDRMEAAALSLTQELFASLTAPSERADHGPRERYVEKVNRFPDRKGRPHVVKTTHQDGVSVGDEAERAELEAEELGGIRRQDRDSENQVAGTTVATTSIPTVTSDDDSDLTSANGTPGAVVIGPPVPPAPPTPTPAPPPPPATGTFKIPVDLK
jgi:hypothetical protein